MTPAEIIYQRRVAVLAHARQIQERGADVPGLWDLADVLLRMEGRGRPLRPGRPHAQGPPDPPDARGHSDPRHRGPAHLGRGRAHHWLSPIRRPFGRPRVLDRQVDRAASLGGPRAGPARPAPGSSGRHHRGHDRACDRGGERGRALRVLPGQRGSGRARLPGLASTSASSRAWARCTSSPPSTSSPAGLSSPSCSARSTPPTPCASSTRCCATTVATGCGSGPCSAITVPSTSRPDFRAHLVAKGLRHERIPARSPNHNAVCERFHGTILQECWRPAFHRRHFTSIRQLGAEADAWLDHLQPPPAQPRRLHAGPHPASDPRQPQEKQGSMTTINRRDHLSPRLSVRKL